MDKLLCQHAHDFLDLELHEVTLLLWHRRSVLFDKMALYRLLRAGQAKHHHEEG
jgi:hypothetical protein